MRLHIGVFGLKEFLSTLDGKTLGDVNKLASPVVTFARQAFGILVGKW